MGDAQEICRELKYHSLQVSASSYDPLLPSTSIPASLFFHLATYFSSPSSCFLPFPPSCHPFKKMPGCLGLLGNPIIKTVMSQDLSQHFFLKKKKLWYMCRWQMHTLLLHQGGVRWTPSPSGRIHLKIKSHEMDSTEKLFIIMEGELFHSWSVSLPLNFGVLLQTCTNTTPLCPWAHGADF